MLAATLDINHIQAIVQALYHLAETDGVHESEKNMMEVFYQSCQAEGRALASYDDLVSQPFNASEQFRIFTTDEQKGALLHSCILLGYADGHYSVGERKKVAEYAQLLQIDDVILKSLEESVSDQLLQQISRINNIEALQQVSRELHQTN
jgi:tellurite resistance protein